MLSETVWVWHERIDEPMVVRFARCGGRGAVEMGEEWWRGGLWDGTGGI